MLVWKCTRWQLMITEALCRFQTLTFNLFWTHPSWISRCSCRGKIRPVWKRTAGENKTPHIWIRKKQIKIMNFNAPLQFYKLKFRATKQLSCLITVAFWRTRELFTWKRGGNARGISDWPNVKQLVLHDKLLNTKPELNQVQGSLSVFAPRFPDYFNNIEKSNEPLNSVLFTILSYSMDTWLKSIVTPLIILLMILLMMLLLILFIAEQCIRTKLSYIITIIPTARILWKANYDFKTTKWKKSF